MLGSVKPPDSSDPTVVRQLVEIAVHGAEADAGQIPADIPVDHVCGRMIFAGAQKIHDGLSLSGIIHVAVPEIKISNDY